MYKLLYNRRYNKPTSWAMLWNQWIHAGFLWGFWSYDWYAKHQKELPQEVSNG